MKLQKHWYTLHEVADRWSKLTSQAFTVDDVLYFEESGELRIAALLNDDLRVKCLGTNSQERSRQIEEQYPEYVELRRDEIQNPERIMSGICYPVALISRQFRKGNEIRFGMVRPAEHYAHIEDFMFLVLGVGAFAQYHKPVRYAVITRDDLRITRVELDRFEQAQGSQGIDKPDTTTAPDTVESTSSINRPWAHLIDSENPKTSGLYKQEAKRIRESLTPEERRAWAREAVARNGGNKTKAGLEMGVTESCIRNYLKTQPKS